jgi:hypothetical protein
VLEAQEYVETGNRILLRRTWFNVEDGNVRIFQESSSFLKTSESF